MNRRDKPVTKPPRTPKAGERMTEDWECPGGCGTVFRLPPKPPASKPELRDCLTCKIAIAFYCLTDDGCFYYRFARTEPYNGGKR